MKVVLTGVLNNNHSRDEAILNLMDTFQMTEDKVLQLIDRAPVTIKSNLDEASAEKYAHAIQRSGFIANIVDDELNAAESSTIAETEQQPGQAQLPYRKGLITRSFEPDFDLTLAEVGQLLLPSESRTIKSADIDTSGLSLLDV